MKRNNYAKKQCEKCGSFIKRAWITKKQVVCWNCHQKMIHIIGVHYSEEELLQRALSKTYQINGYTDKHGRVVASRSFPYILAKRKVKLVLVE